MPMNSYHSQIRSADSLRGLPSSSLLSVRSGSRARRQRAQSGLACREVDHFAGAGLDCGPSDLKGVERRLPAGPSEQGSSWYVKPHARTLASYDEQLGRAIEDGATQIVHSWGGAGYPRIPVCREFEGQVRFLKSIIDRLEELKKRRLESALGAVPAAQVHNQLGRTVDLWRTRREGTPVL